MSIGRNDRVQILTNIEGQFYATSEYLNTIKNGIAIGKIPYDLRTISRAQRLDHLAAQEYGDSSLWWVIAAASDIGWGLQIPGGTLIRVPTDLSYIFERIG